MNIESMIHDFLLKVEEEHVPGTLKYYKNHLNHFLGFAHSQGAFIVSDVTNKLIVSYISHMRKTCENITINKNIGALKLMYRRLNIDFEYLQSIKKFKERRTTFQMISEEDLKRIRFYMKSLPEYVDNNLYYKSLILLLMDTGARISEILLIEKKHVSLKEREILLTHTKTKEDRYVFISDITADVLGRLMQVETKHQYLLHNIRKNRPGTYNDVIWWMRQLKKILKLSTLHAHMFRHSLATIWLENGADLASVQGTLGHRNIETTGRYIHNNKAHAKKMYHTKFKLD